MCAANGTWAFTASQVVTYRPSGTGKTMMATAPTGELGAPLMLMRLNFLITSFTGETTAKFKPVRGVRERSATSAKLAQNNKHTSNHAGSNQRQALATTTLSDHTVRVQAPPSCGSRVRGECHVFCTVIDAFADPTLLSYD